ncbi:uncharacterized protein LOC129226183 [Uloborus diversus]|uniref:uncharacterized protein LOC129226183 n=1 Tax=Uloborus diversus TaxID=327109 RepID=UPI002409105D|nr:uncharacterized protein LOC129226183 [Uloborus diversus]
MAAEKRFFLSDDEVKLIELVRERPILFSKKRKKGQDINIKENCWREVSETLHIPIDVCKTKWKYLRDYYVRRKHRTYDQPVRYKTEVEKRRRELLTFLDEPEAYVPQEPSISTVHIKQEPADSSDEANSVGSYSQIEIQSYTSNQQGMLDVNDFLEIECHQPQETKYCEEDPVTNISTPETEASDDPKDKLDGADSFVFELPKRDHIDDFFYGLSTTMRTLPTRLIVEAKNELFQVMSKYELRALEMKKQKC